MSKKIYDEELEEEIRKPQFGWIDGLIGMGIGIFFWSLPFILIGFALWAAISLAYWGLSGEDCWLGLFCP